MYCSVDKKALIFYINLLDESKLFSQINMVVIKKPRYSPRYKSMTTPLTLPLFNTKLALMQATNYTIRNYYHSK